MTAGLDQELRAALEAASEFIQPPGTVADHILKRARRKQHRRRALVASVAAFAMLLTGTGLAYLAADHRHPPAISHHGHPARFRLPYGYQVTELTTGGPYLYVLFDQVDVLAAYDLATGRLVRRITVPDTPSAMAVGPGGLVWVLFYANAAGGSSGLWLLSPDLRVHSAIANVGANVIVPTGRTTAWLPGQYGLTRVSMPTPGATGRATAVLQAGTSLGPPLNTAPGRWAGSLDGRVWAQVTDGYGYHSHLIIAGQPTDSYGGGAQTGVLGATQTGGSLWVISGTDANNFGGALIQLNSRLQPTTPVAVERSRVLSQVAAVWSHDDTVWLALGPQSWEGGRSLACFRARAGIGPVTTLPVSGPVVALAATATTVYVSTAPPGQGDSGDGAGVTSYRIPAACH